MKTIISLAFTLCAIILLSGCDKPASGKATSTAGPAVAETSTADKTQGIAWFKGSVDEAFKKASTEKKPLFLYWGAVWCPPCEEIRNTVFKSQDFIALTHLFIPVYVDGDSDNAQAIGERFGVKGYPTMIVFNPAGEEVTRIPGGIDISRYNTVLQLSLDRLKSTGHLLAQAMANPGSLSADDYTQLAYYSWDQDHSVLPEDAPDDLFKTLSESAKGVNDVAASRLYMQYLVNQSRKDREHDDDAPVQLQNAAPRIRNILASKELTLANWDSLAYYPEITKILDLDDAARSALADDWQNTLMRDRNSASLPIAEQLAGWLPKLYFHFKTTDDPLPAEDANALESDISRANRAVTDPFARQSLLSQMAYIYEQAHMYKQARTLLLAELDTSAAPWYFMSELAYLAEKQDNKEEAIKWYRQAWETSKGAATRLQWGASYVRSLVRLSPDDKDLILSSAESLFKEVPADAMFSGRNFRVMRRLQKELVKWQTDATKPELQSRFVAHIERLCSQEPSGSIEKTNCQSLVDAESAG